jgi:death-on-curing protein
MMRYLSIGEVIELHRRIISQTRGADGLRDLSALESAVAQPFQSFDGEELYPSVVAKAAALAFFIISNHPFVDGNKRVGHAALEVTLVLNGAELIASTILRMGRDARFRGRLTRARSWHGPASARRPSRLVKARHHGGTRLSSRASNAGKPRAAPASARGPWPCSLTAGSLGGRGQRWPHSRHQSIGAS